MANTHYLWIVGDAHNAGPSLGLQDPGTGVYIETLPGAGTIIEGAVFRAATSTFVGRVVRKISDTQFYALAIGSGVGTPPGSPFGTLAQSSPPFAGEVLTFDSGGGFTRALSPLRGALRYGSIEQQLPGLTGMAELNTYTPPDPTTDTVFWDPKAKVASQILIPVSSISPASPTPNFVPGDRIRVGAGVGAGGGEFTVLTATVVGSDLVVTTIRREGTIVQGALLTNLTRTASGQIKNTVDAVEQSWPVGCWAPHHVLPNLAGLGLFYEIPPWGDGGGIGVYGPLVRSFWQKWSTSADPADRGVRVLPFSAFDFTTGADSLVGGVTVQRVQCSGTFPITWQTGETVTCGAWSAKVWGFNAANKWLFVTNTNDQVLAGGAITGATSGSAGTCSGPAHGWQKGCSHFQALLSTYATASTQSQPYSKGLYQSQPAKVEGIYLSVWESEMSCFAPVNGATWPTVELMVERWSKFIADLREAAGNPNLPIALMQMDVRSQSATVAIGAFPFSILLIEVLNRLTAIPGVTLANSEGMQPQTTAALPYPTQLLYVRPQDYRTFGERAWRALNYSSTPIPTGNFTPLPILFIAGQSWAVGGIPGGWAFSEDPDMLPTSAYPGASTSVPTIYNFDMRPGVEEWRVYDVVHSANTFLGMTGFGFEAPILTRWAKRFGQDGDPGEVGLIKCAFGGASASGTARGAPVTFDPTGAAQVSTIANCNVTLIPADSNNGSRARFTSVGGTFSAWGINAFGRVTGSRLGQQGLGGNNSLAWTGGYVTAVDPAGAWVEILGNFVAEGGTGTGYLVNNVSGYSIGATSVAVDTGSGTILAGDRFTFANHGTVYTVTSTVTGTNLAFSPALTAAVPNNTALSIQPVTFTLTQGPYAMATEIERLVRIALEKCVTQLRRIPVAAARIWWNGEADLEVQSDYQLALTRVLDWMARIFDQRIKGAAPAPSLVMLMTPNTGWNASDEAVAAQIAIQQQVAAARQNCLAVPVDDLPMELKPGAWPRSGRQDNGLHTTPSGYMLAGRRADYYLAQLPGIPAHPDGEDSSLARGLAASGTTGTTGGGTETAGLRAEEETTTTTTPTKAIGTASPILLDLVVEDGTGRSDAESYLSVSEFRSMALRVGNPLEVSDATDAVVQSWLRLSARWGVDAIYSAVLTGVRTRKSQALEWPRDGAGDNRTADYLNNDVIPADWKWCQFWFAIALAMGIDVLEDIDVSDEDVRKRWATSTGDALPGGFNEQRTYGDGVPRRSVLPRMHAAAVPFLMEGDDRVGIA